MNNKADKVEMRNDGSDLDRFEKMLKTVVAIPKADLKKEKNVKRRKKRRKAKNPSSFDRVSSEASWIHKLWPIS